MINKVILVGNLGADPEVRAMPSGKKIANFSVATSSKDKDGNKRSEWHKVTAFSDGLVSGVIEPYVKKGAMVYLEGSLQTRKYNDKSGIERYITEVIIGFGDTLKILNSKNDGASGGYQSYESKAKDMDSSDVSAADDVNDDDIPF